MLGQMGLVLVTLPFERVKSDTAKLAGNCFFWVTFTILGQPLMALGYYYFWQGKYGSVSKTLAMSPPVSLKG